MTDNSLEHSPGREDYPCKTYYPAGIKCVGTACFVTQRHLGYHREVFHCFYCNRTWDTVGDPVEVFNAWVRGIESETARKKTL